MTHVIIQQGTTWAMEWTVTDDTDQPLDVTGWGVKSQIRATPEAETVLHEWSNVAGNAVPGNGSVMITVSPATSSAWTWRSGVFDIELTNLSGQVARLDEGTVEVSPEITR